MFTSDKDVSLLPGTVDLCKQLNVQLPAYLKQCVADSCRQGRVRTWPLRVAGHGPRQDEGMGALETRFVRRHTPVLILQEPHSALSPLALILPAQGLTMSSAATDYRQWRADL